ncbi:hypothetical protein AAFF_G00323940 [Aldrovandia affinis]|uniref:AIG1-type G domain-containing protein n=1 Tax=Aldrovandia affinis TaxID=143900 RepID=A0AAD7R6P6_9TELE|nr:hypothetical protein AAFF_G00323940 [Aldrovandia affinis]
MIKEIVKCISLSSPGPHVFLVVIQLGRFTKEEQDTVEIIQETFGPESSGYTMVLFTHGDRLKGKSIEDFIGYSKDLADFTDECRGGYHVFNNEDMKNRSQVTELLQKIDKMVALNGGGCYTNEMYRRVEQTIEEEKKRILRANEEERHREQEALKAKYEGEALEQSEKELREEHERKAREKAERGSTVLNILLGIAQGALSGLSEGLISAAVGGVLGGIKAAKKSLKINKSEKCTIQ